MNKNSAFCVVIGNRFLIGFTKKGRLQTAWHITGATLYYKFDKNPLSDGLLRGHVEQLNARGDKYQICEVSVGPHVLRVPATVDGWYA